MPIYSDTFATAWSADTLQQLQLLKNFETLGIAYDFPLGKLPHALNLH